MCHPFYATTYFLWIALEMKVYYNKHCVRCFPFDFLLNFEQTSKRQLVKNVTLQWNYYLDKSCAIFNTILWNEIIFRCCVWHIFYFGSVLCVEMNGDFNQIFNFNRLIWSYWNWNSAYVTSCLHHVNGTMWRLST